LSHYDSMKRMLPGKSDMKNYNNSDKSLEDEILNSIRNDKESSSDSENDKEIKKVLNLGKEHLQNQQLSSFPNKESLKSYPFQ